MTNEIDCSSSTAHDSIPSDQHVWIITVGNKEDAYLQFSFGTVDIYSFTLSGSVICAGVFLISSIVGCFILFILSKSTEVKLSNSENKIKDHAIIISIEMNKARAAFNEINRREGKPIQNDPVAMENAKYSQIGN